MSTAFICINNVRPSVKLRLFAYKHGFTLVACATEEARAAIDKSLIIRKRKFSNDLMRHLNSAICRRRTTLVANSVSLFNPMNHIDELEVAFSRPRPTYDFDCGYKYDESWGSSPTSETRRGWRNNDIHRNR